MSSTFEEAALELMQQSLKEGDHLNVYLYFEAVEKGHLKIIEWLRVNGCP